MNIPIRKGELPTPEEVAAAIDVVNANAGALLLVLDATGLLPMTNEGVVVLLHAAQFLADEVDFPLDINRAVTMEFTAAELNVLDEAQNLIAGRA